MLLKLKPIWNQNATRVSGLIKEFSELKRRCSALKEFKLQHFNSIGWVEHRQRVCLEEEPLDKLIFTFWRGSLALHCGFGSLSVPGNQLS